MHILKTIDTDEFGLNPVPGTMVLEDVIQSSPSSWTCRCDESNPLYLLLDAVRMSELFHKYREAYSSELVDSYENADCLLRYLHSGVDNLSVWDFNDAYTAVYDMCSANERNFFGNCVWVHYI